MTAENKAQMIESTWEKIQSRITIEDAINSFINQSLDQCGITICLSAFQLVSQVLDQGGYVRRINKSENSNLSSVLESVEGPWVEQDKQVNHHWDYTGSWLSNIDKISTSASKSTVDWQRYHPVDKEKVFHMFCEPVDYKDKIKVKTDSILKRYERAKFRFLGGDVKKTDPDSSWSPLHTIPEDQNTFFTYKPPNYKLCEAPSHGTFKTKGHENRVVQRWETKTMENCEDNSSATDNIEPYWMFDLRSKKEWNVVELQKYEYNKKNISITSIQKPDLVMEITYTCPKLFVQKKRVVIVEIDGEDKTYQCIRTEENSTRHDYFKTNPAKLSMKLMQSTSVQSVLQPHTYNIRTNFYSYLKETVNRSLQNTTNLELPSFQEILNRLTHSNLQNSGLDDFHQLTQTIHIVWHIFRAHVKVAYLIFMREVHNIDIRDGFDESNVDKQVNNNMKDHHFFINFNTTNIPNELNFTDKMSEPIRKYLENKLMLQTPGKIKVFDMTEGNTQGNLIQSKWVSAPLMSTEKSNMKNWTANVSSGSVPILSNEDTTSVPITYATIQRVDMNKLCELVKKISAKAFDSYKVSRLISKKEDFIHRRDFPDRCYLTRKDQLDRNKWWNKQLGDPETSLSFVKNEKCELGHLRPYGIAVRQHTENYDSDLMELNFGYEKPDLQKDYRQRQTSMDMDKCKWDQVDIRMHYFYTEMEKWKKENKEDWQDYANGMWYTEDYVSFLRMLQSLQEPTSADVFEGDKCRFTCEPEIDNMKSKEFNLKTAVISTNYRLRLHNHQNRKNQILNDINLINLFWQSKKNQNFVLKTKIETFQSIIDQMTMWKDGEDTDQLYADLEEKIMSYLVKKKVIIPIFESLHQSSKKKQRKGKSKTSLCFAKIDDTVAARYQVNYVGFDGMHDSFNGLQIIHAFELYARKRETKIETTLKVDDFFENITADFKKQVTLAKSDNPLYSIEHTDKILDDINSFDSNEKWDFTHKEYKYLHSLPSQSPQQDLAYHIYSILCFFFNCRDDGACRYRWEEWLLNYFGANCSNGTKSDFHKFEFQTLTPTTTYYEYFNQTWFQMCFFLEHNFRNALSALHYKLFEMQEEVGYFPDVNDKVGLQTIARRVYHREKSLLNNRSSFVGLGNVSMGLSFQKYNARSSKNLTLRDRIMSQLNDELPDLDPTLVRYVRKFRIPDSELFLRIIRCPNILALRELARQHMSLEPQKHMRDVLQFFEPAIQSEIELMLKFVQTDESVYVSTPEAHPSKRLILTEIQLLKWMRETVNCCSFSSALGMQNNVTPLQCKYDMFLNPKTFHVLKNLFCTRDLLNFGNQRPLKFILLQLALVDKIIASDNIEDCIHANDSLYMTLKLKEVDITPLGFNVAIDIDGQHHSVPCVINTSRRGWPKRDFNRTISYNKVQHEQVLDIDLQNDSGTQDHSENFQAQALRVFDSLHATSKEPELVIQIEDGNPEAAAETHDEMTEIELQKWMLLSYARPCIALNSELNVSITQENFIKNPLYKGDCEDVELHYKEEVHENRHILSCFIHRVEKHVYFERYEKSHRQEDKNNFPLYVQAIIPKKTDCKMIYIPEECAVIFRKVKWPVFFTHEVDGQVYKWRPVFVGVRTWCWKRFLVKLIFLHSFGKILTRTKTLVSLYTNQTDVKDSEIMDILKTANATSMDTFGDLSRKEKWLAREHRKIQHKKMQKKNVSVLSLRKYKCRMYYDSESEKHFETLKCCKLTSIQKQLKWLSYVEEHKMSLDSVPSCRFMRVDKIFENDVITDNAYSIGTHDDFYLYRDYLYFDKEKTCMVVNLNNTYFLKFPNLFIIRGRMREGQAEKTSIVCKSSDDILKTNYFLTAFDTRRYDWFKKIQIDTVEDTKSIQKYKKIHLKTTRAENIRTISNQLEDGLQWALNLNTSFEDSMQTFTPGYSVSSLSQSSTLYTLPDFYVQQIKSEILSQIFTQKPNVVDIQPTTEEQLKTLAWWLKCRMTSSFLKYDNKTLNEESSRIFQNDVLATMMTNINRILKPQASKLS